MMMWIEDGRVRHSRWPSGCNGNPSEPGNPLFDGNSDAIPEGEQSAVIPSDPVSALPQDGGAPQGTGGAGNEQSGLPSGGFGPSSSFPEAGQGLPGANPSYHDNDDDDDDDNGNDSSLFNLSPRKGGSSYNVFFPIQFSHRARSAGRSSGTYNAIANSFATGRKGLANSHSLTHGNAAPSQAPPQGQPGQNPEA
nr:unnamed protein product [Callosobruchus chinensis]